MNAVGRAYVPIEPDFKRFNKAANSQAKAAGKRIAKAIGGALVVGGAISEAKKSIGLIKELAKGTAALSRTTGMDEKQSSRWISTMRARGVEATKLQVSFTALSRQILAARSGSKSAVAGFEALGVSMETIEKGGTQDVLGEIADGFAKMKNGPEKTAIAAKLFGRSYQALLPLLNEGKASMEDALAVSDKYGNTLSKKQVAAALLAVKAQREMGMATDGLRIQLGTALLPVITKVAQGAADFVAQLRSGEGPVGRVGRVVKNFATDLASVVAPALDLVKDGIDKLPGSFKAVIGVAGGLGLVFAATGPIGLAVAAAAGAAVLIKRNWETIGPIFESVKATIESAFGSVSAWVQTAITNVTKWLDLGGGKAGNFGQAVSNALTGVKAVVESIAKAFTWAFQNVILPVIKRVLPGVQQYIEGVVTSIGGIVKIFTGIFTGDFSKAFEGVKQLLRGMFKSMFGMIRASSAPLRAVAALLFKGFVGAIKGSVKLVVSAAKGIGSAIWNAVKGLPGRLFDLGKSVVSRFAKGISGLGSSLGRALKSGFNFFGNLGRGIADWINSHTPLGDQVTLNLGVKKIKFTLPALYKGGPVPGIGKQALAEVNERGPESITDPKTGRTRMLGDGRRQVMSLPVGWMVNTAAKTRRMFNAGIAQGGDGIPAYSRGGYVKRYKPMLGKAVKIAHQNLAYSSPGPDCSWYVSEILKAGKFISSRYVSEDFRKLAKGAGKVVTVGVWKRSGTDGSGNNGHTMMKMQQPGARPRFFESGSGHGPKEVGGWSMPFDFYHPRGEHTLAKSAVSKIKAKVRATKPKKPVKLTTQERRDNRLAQFAYELSNAEIDDDTEDLSTYDDNKEVLERRIAYVDKIIVKLKAKLESLRKKIAAVTKKIAAKGISNKTRAALVGRRATLTKQQTKVYEDLSSYGGMIQSDRNTIKGFANGAAPSPSSDSSSGDSEALRQINQNLKDQLRMQSAQFPVFARFADRDENPYVGKFHDGGIVPGRRGQEVNATLLAGEEVIPVGGVAPANFQIIVEKGAGVDPELIKVVAVGAVQEENRRAARRARTGPLVGRRTG